MTFSIDTCYEGRRLVKAVYMSGLLCPSQCMELMWVPTYTEYSIQRVMHIKAE